MSARSFLLVVCSILGLLAHPSFSMVPCCFCEHCAVLSPSSSFLTGALAHALYSMAKPSQPSLSEMFSLPPMWLFQSSFLLQLHPHHFHCLYSLAVQLFEGWSFYFVNRVAGHTIVLCPWFTHFPVFLARILLVISLCASLVLLTIECKHLLWVGLSLWLWKVFALSISCIACQVFHVASVGFRTSVRRMPWNAQALILHFNIVWRTMSSVSGMHREISSLTRSVISSE